MLPELPASFVATRLALHAVAEQVVAPARAEATGGEISLRALPGGFGAPPLPGGGWVWVDAAELVRDGAREPIAGADPAAARVLARVYAFGQALLDALRADATPADDVSIARLWPEHFDIAIEHGDEAAGARAAYGVSPGDDDHDEPYVYVAPWTAPPAGEVWNAVAFKGAELGWAQLREAGDPHVTALAFLRERREALAS
jgi:hypothetical protein